MTARARLIEDATLPIFPADQDAETPDRVHPDLVVAHVAGGAPFRLDGDRVSVLGTERGPVDAIRFDGVRAVSELRSDPSPVANVLVSPGVLRRERVGPTGSSEETLMALPTLPVAWVAWTRATPVRLTVLPRATSIRYRLGDGCVTVAETGSDRLLSISSTSPGCIAALEAAPDGGAVVALPGGPGPSALAVAFGPEEAVRTALRALSHLPTHERRAGRAAGDGSVVLETGARDLDDAVAWMSTRLSRGIRVAAAADDDPDGDPLAWLWAGLGAVAVADAGSAESCVHALRRIGRNDAAALVAARLALTSGHTNLALEHASELPLRDPLARLASRMLADALRYAAPETLLTGLRSAGTDRPRSDAPADREVRTPRGGGGRTLPMVTAGGRVPRVDEWLPPLLEPSDRHRPVRGAPLLDRPGAAAREANDPGPALAAWAGLAGEAGGWAEWRSRVASGYESGPGGVGAWDPLASRHPPAVTGILLAAMVHGWLGIHPDAPVGRLRLAPRLPPRLTGFAVRGITVGDARVGLTYRRSGSNHSFELEPEWGRTPPLVVFETVVPHAVQHVTIDGNAAELDLVRTEEGTLVRLQTPVDGPRRIEILGS